ncbi:MAG: hypothetical protein ABSD38_33615, partial [Syntrophorhabdales bacterium]
KLFVAPAPSSLAAVAAAATLPWGTAATTITVTVNDQNGQPLPGNYTLQAAFTRGNGTVLPSPAVLANNSSVTFTYTRGDVSTDQSPILAFALSGYPAMAPASLFISLLDGSGNIMM